MAVDRALCVDAGDAWAAAVELVEDLGRGFGLPGLGSPFRDGSEEVLHVRTTANLHRLEVHEVVYDTLAFVDFAGRAGWGSELRWTAGGECVVLVSDRRIAFEVAGGWTSIWYAHGFDHALDASNGLLYLRDNTGTQFCLEGPWSPYLTVALVHAATGNVLDVVGTA